MIKNMLIGLINLYQKIPGPWHNYCRHVPTCSEYMKEAIIIHGSLKGLKLGIIRILKCNPFGTFGYDPVPKKGEKNEK